MPPYVSRPGAGSTTVTRPLSRPGPTNRTTALTHHLAAQDDSMGWE